MNVSRKAPTSPAGLIQIYRCFCDETRLRIVNLLAHGPLCVCHLQELLDSPQVKISKHLGYLKAKGVVTAERRRNWMIYSLPEKPSAALDANLKCLQDCTQTHAIFKADVRRLSKIAAKVEWLNETGECCAAPAPKARRSLSTRK